MSQADGYVRIVTQNDVSDAQRSTEQLGDTIHNALDTLMIYQKATVQKLPMYPSYAISLPVLVENGNNFRR